MTTGELSRIASVNARVRSGPLDRALIDGAEPATNPRLTARAATLTAAATRRRIADGLDRLARSGEPPRARWRVLPFAAAARANATELHALAALLRGSTPVYPRGVAMLRALLRDGAGPAYTDRDGRELARRLHRARLAIGG